MKARRKRSVIVVRGVQSQPSTMNKKELNALHEMKDKLRDARALWGDPEVSHMDADEALLGFFDTIDPEIRIIFEGVQKYYA